MKHYHQGPKAITSVYCSVLTALVMPESVLSVPFSSEAKTFYFCPNKMLAVASTEPSTCSCDICNDDKWCIEAYNSVCTLLSSSLGCQYLGGSSSELSSNLSI